MADKVWTTLKKLTPFEHTNEQQFAMQSVTCFNQCCINHTAAWKANEAFTYKEFYCSNCCLETNWHGKCHSYVYMYMICLTHLSQLKGKYMITVVCLSSTLLLLETMSLLRKICWKIFWYLRYYTCFNTIHPLLIVVTDRLCPQYWAKWVHVMVFDKFYFM